MASLTARPFGRLREGTRNPESAGSVIGTLGNFSASIGKAKSKKTFNVSAIVAAALKTDGTKLHGGTARKQAENTLCGHRAKHLPLRKGGKTDIAHGGTARRQKP